MPPSPFDLLERYYRPRRAVRLIVWSGGLVLFGLLMISALWVLVNGVDEVPTYQCSPGSTDHADCVRRYEARAAEFAEMRALYSLVPLAAAALFFAAWWPIRSPSAPTLTRMIRERPLDIVWLYPKQVTRKKRGHVMGTRHMLVFGSTDRKLREIELSEQEVAQAMPIFLAALPHVTVGHDSEKQTRFHGDPASMRRAGAAPPHSPTSASGPQAGPAMGGGFAPHHAAGPPAGAATPPVASAAVRVFVAPQVPFGHVDHVLRTLGLAPSSAAPLVAPGEPGMAAWSSASARVVYRYDLSTRTRSLELFAQDPGALRAHIAHAGIPMSNG